MSKLHELIAVEGQLEGIYRNILVETADTLKNKPQHFNGSVKTYTPFKEEDVEKESITETVEITTTVTQKLDYMFSHVVRYLDAVAQKEATNQTAKANIEIDGKILVKDVPATFLLGMETKLKQIREVFQKIPTQAPGIDWKLDKEAGDDIYKTSQPVKSFKSQKSYDSKVLYEATKDHPAQLEKWTIDVHIGTYVKTLWSGMLTPAQKSHVLLRIDELLRAIKTARQRANCAEVVNIHIGQVFQEYIMGGLDTK